MLHLLHRTRIGEVVPISVWSNLATGQGEPDWMPLAREFRACQQRFILHVQSWENCTPPQTLSWTSVRYDSNQDAIDDRGVYAFVLDASKYSPSPIPPQSCVIYVGEIGDSSSETLKTRLKNYRNKKLQRDHARVFYMLEHWGTSLLFYCAVVNQGVSTKFLGKPEDEVRLPDPVI